MVGKKMNTKRSLGQMQRIGSRLLCTDPPLFFNVDDEKQPMFIFKTKTLRVESAGNDSHVWKKDSPLSEVRSNCVCACVCVYVCVCESGVCSMGAAVTKTTVCVRACVCVRVAFVGSRTRFYTCVFVFVFSHFEGVVPPQKETRLSIKCYDSELRAILNGPL